MEITPLTPRYLFLNVQFPNYLWAYLHHHVSAELTTNFIVIYYFSKKPRLIKFHRDNVSAAVIWAKNLFANH
jgi:hypothetical protein